MTSDVKNIEVAENKKIYARKTKVNKLDQKIFNATTLIHINQYNTDRPNLEEITKDVDKTCQTIALY